MRVLVAIDGSGDAKAAVAWLSRLPLPAGHTIRFLLVVVPPIALIDVARFFLGSVSLAVVRDAPCPVLVCKGPPRELDAITVALDGSDHARQALGWLTNVLTLPPSTRLRLFGVAEAHRYPSSTPSIGSALGAALAALKAERRARLEDELSAAATSLRARLPAIETAVLTGEAADMIVRDVERRATDLVVLGARGLGVFRRLLLGSVSESVLTHAACSVLIVRPRAS